MTFDQSKNLRSIIELDDTELRASLQKSGWLPQFPAFADENGVLIVGHRRMKIAEELGIKPVVETIHFGNGSEGDADKRLELAIASNIGAAALSKKDRESIAQLASDHGYTQEQIGKILGVSQQAISKLNLQPSCNSKPAKTATNPKGAGRPRTKKPSVPKPHPLEAKVVNLSNAGLTQAEIGAEIGKTTRAARDILERGLLRREGEPTIDPDMLSLSAQQKLNAAIKQEKNKLQQQFEAAVVVEVDKRVRTYMEAVSGKLAKEREEYKKVMNARHGLMTKKDYMKVWMQLHPDKALSPARDSEEMKKDSEEAFDIFSKLRRLVLNEKDCPTPASAPPPKTMAEWEELRRKTTQERKAKYAASRANKGKDLAK